MGATILILIVLGGFWMMQRRRRREAWHAQRPTKPPTDLEQPKSKVLDANGLGAGTRITVTLTEAKVSDPDLVVIDRSYLAAPADNSSLSSTATTNPSYDPETISETDTSIPFFQRLKLLRRAGEMPRRKSVVLDQYTVQQLSNPHAKMEVVEVEVARQTYVLGEQMKRSLEVESIDSGVVGDRMELRESSELVRNITPITEVTEGSVSNTSMVTGYSLESQMTQRTLDV